MEETKLKTTNKLKKKKQAIVLFKFSKIFN